MKENWYALFLAIVKDFSVDKALGQMYIGYHKQKHIKETTKKVPYEKFSIEDVTIMVEMKKVMSYKKVAQHFNTNDRNIYNHIKKYFPELIKSGQLGYHKKHNQKFVS